MSRDYLTYEERVRDRLLEELKALEAERDRLRAALEEMLIIKPRDEAEAAFHRIARRALEGE